MLLCITTFNVCGGQWATFTQCSCQACRLNWNWNKYFKWTPKWIYLCGRRTSSLWKSFYDNHLFSVIIKLNFKIQSVQWQKTNKFKGTYDWLGGHGKPWGPCTFARKLRHLKAFLLLFFSYFVGLIEFTSDHLYTNENISQNTKFEFVIAIIAVFLLRSWAGKVNDNYNEGLDHVSKMVLTSFTKQRAINESN